MSVGSLSESLLCIAGSINDKRLSFLLDTGATHNFLSMSVAEMLGIGLKSSSCGSVRLADGSTIDCNKYAEVIVSFGTTQSLLRFEVLDCKVVPILGMPFFKQVEPIIDWGNQTVTCKRGSRVVRFCVTNDSEQSPLKQTSVHSTSIEEVNLR